MLRSHVSASLPLAAAPLVVAAFALPSRAAAEQVCVAQDDTPFSRAAPENERPTPSGTLAGRACYPVMERFADRTRVFVAAPQGFKGEVELSNAALARVLVDDVPMRLSPNEEPFGKALSGTLLVLEKQAGGDHHVARALEGRLGARFLVAPDDSFFAESWPEPDPEMGPDKSWPAVEDPGLLLAPPPAPAVLRAGPDDNEARVKVSGALFEVDDVLNDPHLGEITMEFLERREFESHVRLRGRTLWADGWVTEIDWRQDAPPGGWDPMKGVPEPKARRVGAREVGEKPANIAAEAKGEPFGVLQPGARVDVGDEEEGAWVQVRCAWNGGEVQGWIERKRLVKEGDESVPKLEMNKVAAVQLTNLGAKWELAEGHEGDPEMDLEPLRAWLLGRTPMLQRAYALALKKKPTLAGQIAARLLVDPKGVVGEVAVPLKTVESAELDAAVARAFEGLVFEERKPLPRKKGQPELDPDVYVWVQWNFAPAVQ